MTDASNMDGMELFELAGVVATVASAWQTGLLAAVLAHAGSAPHHASALGLDPHATRLVLDGLVALGFLVEEAGVYGRSPAARDLAATLPLDLDRIGQLWGALPGLLRGEGAPSSWGASAHERGPAYAKAVSHLADMTEGAARVLARRLGPVSHVLDLGAGSGVWSLEMARRHPGTVVTGVDLPEVLPVLHQRAERLGVSARGLAGDLHTVALPEADRVVVANVLHLEPEDRARHVVRRAAEVLPSGGELVVVDSFPDGSGRAERQHALYAIQLALRVPGAVVWPANTVEGWMREAGFHRAQLLSLPSPMGPLAALVATRAEGRPRLTPSRAP